MCCITYQSAQEAMIAMFLCSSNKLLKWNSTSSMTMMTQEYQEYFYYVMNNKCLQFPSTTSQDFELYKVLINCENSHV